MSSFPSDEVPNLVEESKYNSEIESPVSDDKKLLFDMKDVIKGIGADQIQQREEIDGVKQSIQILSQKMQEMVDGFNQMGQMIQTQSIPAAQGKDDSAMKFQMISQLMDSKIGEFLINKLSPPQIQENPIISNTEIQEKMRQTFFDNLETGESINNFIKNSLKKSVTKNVINSSLAEIGKSNEPTHEPI